MHGEHRSRRPWIAVLGAAVVLLTALVAAPAAAHGGEGTGTDRTAPVAAVAHGAGAAGASGASSANLPASLPAAVPGEPLSEADKDLLVKVRLAGLWEEPAGRMAAQKGRSPRVREIGAMIGSQHRQLDALVVQAAAELGVPLPDEPNADQKRWLGEMVSASGERFDHVFVDRLRAAHGKVFPVIAQVRAGTRNTVVREFAQSSNDFVLTHLTLLESTDLVDYESLPPPPEPSGTATSSSGAVLSSLVGNVTSFVRSPPPNFGWILPVVVLLVVPALLRIAVRRWLAERAVAGAATRRLARSTAGAGGPPPSPYSTPPTGSTQLVGVTRRLRTPNRPEF